jgi:hypothetical protein
MTKHIMLVSPSNQTDTAEIIWRTLSANGRDHTSSKKMLKETGIGWSSWFTANVLCTCSFGMAAAAAAGRHLHLEDRTCALLSVHKFIPPFGDSILLIPISLLLNTPIHRSDVHFSLNPTTFAI